MLKLKRYVLPYVGLLLAAVIMLFGQAMLNLELPNVMSDIVNNGIQKGGITEAAPKAIDQTALQTLSLFMTEQDRQTVQTAYKAATPQNLGDEWEKFVQKYPAAETGAVYYNSADKDGKAELDRIFSTAGYAFISTLRDIAEQSGAMRQPAENAEAAEGSTPSFDMEMLAKLMPALQMLPPQALEKSIEDAAVLPEVTTAQTAAVLNKAFYQQLNCDTDAIQTQYIWITGLKMLGLCGLILLLAVGAGYCLSRFGAGIGRDLRRDIFARVTDFTNNEMDKFSTASLITRTTNDITQVQMFLTMGLRMLCFAPIMGVGGLIMALNKSLGMAWIIALAVVVLLGLILVLFTVAMPKFKIMQDLVDRLNLVSRENLSGMMVIRAFATQEFEEKRFDKANTDLTKNTLFVSRSMATMMPIMSLLMNVVMLAVVWFGAHQIEQSALQVGDMMAFMQYAMHVIMSFLFISMMFIMVPRASVSAERINEVLATESSVKDPENPQQLTDKKRVTVAFRDVSFCYTGADEKVLEHISFTAEPGKTTAFIGSTGSGKSTLVNLVPRFYDATEGSITLNGVDVRDMTQHELHELIGYVPQKGLLFSGDVNSNLRYGDENASQETVQTAAEVAQADAFIRELDDGYDTAISQGGTNVSGGQRQRLSIARALVKKAPIYIFDDTFSALDFKTDAKLRAALSQYTTDATVLIVAQRVSTIMQADLIIVLDEGKIAGMGTHKQLLQNCEIYREIASSQLSKEELE